MSLSDRLRRLEQQHGAIRWCRCPYDADRHRAETEWAMESGEPTPSVCAECDGNRVSIQYVPRRELRGTGYRDRRMGTDDGTHEAQTRFRGRS